ncbi:MAG: prolyl oligopeptidase family serine peptidase [Dehalococcoidia bacterium]
MRPVDAVRRLGDVPVLLIHSEHDEIVPYSHALELDAALTGPHELWTTTGVRHAMMRFALADEYLERVSGFFYRHLHTAAAAVS